MNNGWDLADAIELLAKQKAEAESPPCPACGAPAEVDLFNVTMIGHDPSFAVGYRRCSKRCWREQPQRYVDAVRGMT